MPAPSFDPPSSDQQNPANRRPAGRPVAVALKYEFGNQSLPKIVATGKGHVAEQILELAFANGVKVREDADLVQILSAVDVDSDIPIEAIVAVAEILAYVYRANGTVPNAADSDADTPSQGGAR